MASIPSWRLALVALPVLLATVGCTSVTRTEAQISDQVIGLPNGARVRVLVIRSVTNGVRSESYRVEHRETSDVLGTGIEPAALLERCRATPRATLVGCAMRILVWGEVLAQVEDTLVAVADERARAKRFSLAALGTLRADLEDARSGTQAWQRHQAALRLALPLPDYSKPPPRDLLLARTDYALAFWERVPKTAEADSFTPARWTAQYMSRAVSVLKDEGAPPIERALMQRLLGYWKDAIAFHQRAPTGTAEQLRAIESEFGSAVEMRRAGYGHRPGSGQLQPRPSLVYDDVGAAERLVKQAHHWQLLDLESARRVMTDLGARLRAFELAQLQESLRQAQVDADREEEGRLRQGIARLLRESGRGTEAAAQLTLVAANLQATGPQSEYVKVLLSLADERAETGDWRGALAHIDRTLPALRQGLGLEHFADLRRLESTAAASLGQPRPADAAAMAANEATIALLDTLKDIDVQPDPQQRLGRLRALRGRADLSPVGRLRVDLMLFSLLADQRQFAEAEALAIRARPTLAALLGQAEEAAWLGRLLSVQRQRGNIGAFEVTLTEYRRARQALAGVNWRGNSDRLLAEVAFSLQDLQGAEDHVRWRLADAGRQNWGERLGIGSVLDADGDDPQDKLLLARIHLARGEKAQAERLIAALEPLTKLATRTDVIDVTAQTTGREISVELAELEISSGQPQRGLQRLKELVDAVKPLENLGLWTRSALLLAREGSRRGQDMSALAARLEQMAEQMLGFRDLDAQAGVEILLFAAEYRNRQGEAKAAERLLDQSLKAAAQGGNLDQQIVAHRLLGEFAEAAGQLDSAITSYRRSAGLLKSVSREIPGDIAKVGYRAERGRVVPRLIGALRRRHAASGDPRWLDELVEAIELGKAQALSELLFDRQDRSRNFTVASVRAALGSQAAAVVFHHLEGDDELLLRVVIDGRTTRVETVPASVRQLEERVRQLLDMLANPHLFSEAAYRARAAELAALLLPERWRDAGSTPHQRWYIVPTGIVNLVPFAALVDHQGRYVDEWPVQLAYLPNLSALALAPPVRPQPTRALAVVNPARDREHHETLRANPHLKQRFSTAFTRWSGGTIDWESGWRLNDFNRVAASLDNVFLFAHARFLPEDPLNSYIRLAGGPSDPATRLTARAIMQRPIGAGLWVLAACSTGAGQVRPGDEVLGLPRALLQSGARAAVISLWDVDAASSMELMSNFYENLAAGMPLAQALKTSSAVLRAQGRLPFDWAPFVLVGHHDFALR